MTDRKLEFWFSSIDFYLFDFYLLQISIYNSYLFELICLSASIFLSTIHQLWFLMFIFFDVWFTDGLKHTMIWILQIITRSDVVLNVATHSIIVGNHLQAELIEIKWTISFSIYISVLSFSKFLWPLYWYNTFFISSSLHLKELKIDHVLLQKLHHSVTWW